MVFTPEPHAIAPHHIQLAFIVDQCGNAEGGQRAGGQRVVGVHRSAVLIVAVFRDGRIKAWPEHPEVDCTCVESNTIGHWPMTSTFTVLYIYIQRFRDYSEIETDT